MNRRAIWRGDLCCLVDESLFYAHYTVMSEKGSLCSADILKPGFAEVRKIKAVPRWVNSPEVYSLL